MTQPEALFLADVLERSAQTHTQATAAAELRRLYAELERCKQVCAATSEGWRADADKWPVQKPVAMDWLHKWANQDDGKPETQWHEGYEAARRVVQIHLTAPPTAEPVQEPVANRAFLERILIAMEGVIDVADRKTDEFDALRSCVVDLTMMLHTAPPQRKPLETKHLEQIMADCFADFADKNLPTNWWHWSLRSFARAIERAHGIGEQQ